MGLLGACPERLAKLGGRPTLGPALAARMERLTPHERLRRRLASSPAGPGGKNRPPAPPPERPNRPGSLRMAQPGGPAGLQAQKLGIRTGPRPEAAPAARRSLSEARGEGRTMIDPSGRQCRRTGALRASAARGTSVVPADYIRFDSLMPPAARRCHTPRRIAAVKAGLNDPRAERSSRV